jgi:manganese/zinc/iron transport system substrate-binding protein
MNMLPRFKIFAVVSVIAVLVFSVVNSGQANNVDKNERLYIVTTTSQVGDLVKKIAGDKARVESLMGAGVDPHLYRPTRSDMVKLKRADMVFYNGMSLEAQMDEVLELLSLEKPVTSVADALSQSDKLQGPNGKAYDPHIWMNVNNWISATEIVMASLSEALPSHTAYLKNNAQSYSAQLISLNNMIAKAVLSIPAQNRVLITAHDAFGYFGSAYGVEVVGVQGLSTESEAGLKHIEELVERVYNSGIPALFSETSVQDRNVNAVIAGVKRRGNDVRLGGHLYSDAMGAADTYEGTYIGMMVHNVSTITKALNGQPDGLLELAALNAHATLSE